MPRPETREPRRPSRASATIDALAGSWWVAYRAAEAALQRAGHSLDPQELAERRQRLSDERAAVVALLREVDHAMHAQSPLLRWLAGPTPGASAVGLPSDVVACIFDLDGVLTTSATAHAAAWARTFDTFLLGRAEASRRDFVPFDERHDYRDFLASQPRLVGARAFLASRGIFLPAGSPDDPPGTATVYGLANAKHAVLQQRLAREGVTAFGGSRSYLEGVRMLDLRRAVVSASASTERILSDAGLSGLIEVHVDAAVIEAEGLRPKPAPDCLVAACRRLGVDASQVVAFETTPVGVAAARAAHARLIVAVDRDGPSRALRASDADLVVSDLAELLQVGA